MDYEFQILDNAFLVHRPGIKKFKHDRARAIISSKTQSIIKHYSYPELRVFYGTRKGCIVWPTLPAIFCVRRIRAEEKCSINCI